jgi:hypothetical protein
MKKVTVLSFTIVSCVLIAGSILGAKSKKQQGHADKQKIAQIDSASVTYIKKNPPQLKIEAGGQAATPKWSEPELVARVYAQPPPDGIWDYDFVAKPFAGPITQVITPISAELVLDQIPKGMKGVRIHSKSNSKEAKL